MGPSRKAVRWWGLGGLGAKLVGAFIGVALSAEAVFAAVTLLTERSDVASVQRAETTTAVVSALTNAYTAKGSWRGADLKAALALVNASGAGVALGSPAGKALWDAGASSLFRDGNAVLVDRKVTSGGRPVATLRLAFPRGSLDPAARHLRSTLASALLLSAALASAGALAVAVIAARAIVRPVRRLSEAARALGSGTNGVRVGATSGRGELAELGQAFDHMAASLERHERLRQVMVADIAHELRTPVAILQAETESLVDGVREATPESLASLHEEAVRLARMVQDLQTLASADAAGLLLERSWVDLSLVAAEAATSLEARFVERHVHLVQDLSRAVVWGDPNRLRQVVTNLLENAGKFTPRGGAARLAVSAGEHYVQLEVADTGPGIAAEERERVFERFFRGSAGRTAGGTGIGLAVVKQIVEAHGGQVRATSAPNGGALFLVRLPLEPPVEGKELVWPS